LSLGAVIEMRKKIIKRPLKANTREKILLYIRNNPGAHYNGIRDTLEIQNGVLQYHLDALTKTGEIKSRTEGNRKIFFTAGYNPNNVRHREFIISEIRRRYQSLSEKEQVIFDLLISTGPISMKDLSNYANIRFPRHIKPFLRNIEKKMGIVIKKYESAGEVLCEIDLDRYSA
jgi:predicted transcriptional regulator